MARFRKKPHVVEASQWFEHGDNPEVLVSDGGSDGGLIETLEGNMKVSPGDWIITGLVGEFYPCKPDIFDAIYERLD